MNSFASPKVFEANPSVLKKRVFLVAGIAGVAAIAWAAISKNKTGNEPLAFGAGITAVIFSLRFYFMQVMNGPSRLSFAADGITVSNKRSSESVSWEELEGIRYMVSRGGHYWEIKSRGRAALDFYLDGLTGKQREELLAVVQSIELPNVRIVPFYNPFADAA